MQTPSSGPYQREEFRQRAFKRENDATHVEMHGLVALRSDLTSKARGHVLAAECHGGQHMTVPPHCPCLLVTSYVKLLYNQVHGICLSVT